MGLMDLLFRRSIDRRIEEYQQDLITKQCEEVQNMYSLMRGWRHDYKNHIVTMQASLKMGNLEELEKYLGSLTVDLDTVDTVIKTGNVMVDAILNSKLALAKKREIATEVTAQVPDKMTINDVDMCVMIGNLLDNAMESCLLIENKDERFIRVYIGTFRNQFYISVTNSMGGKVKRHGNTYNTTKGENHGFGLKRIDGIVKKYNGFVNRQHEEGVFGTELMFPVENITVRD